jgi:hypothetical protein
MKRGGKKRRRLKRITQSGEDFMATFYFVTLRHVVGMPLTLPALHTH